MDSIFHFFKYSHNDFELAIRLSKDLEHTLATGWSAEGRGLHERLNAIQASPQPIPEPLERSIRYVATIRNKLIHEHDFNAIPERTRFIIAYEDSKAALEQIVKSRSKPSPGFSCSVM